MRIKKPAYNFEKGIRLIMYLSESKVPGHVSHVSNNEKQTEILLL